MYLLKKDYQLYSLQDEQQIEAGEEAFGSQGEVTRAKRKPLEKISQVRRGTQAFLLFIQAYQLILWKQSYNLIHTIGLPAELEQVVKDLWSLRLQLYRDRFEEDKDNGSTFLSSQSVTENETEVASQGKAKWKGKEPPALIETLALCYLAAMILRLPLSMGDLHRYATREDICFIRAIRFIPAALKSKIPAEYHAALDTTSPLGSDQVREAIHDLTLLYRYHFDLEIPPLNTPLLLFKHIRELALPVNVYQTVWRISQMLDIKFHFPSTIGQQRISHLPEMALISLLVIGVKLYHSFLPGTECVTSSQDPAVLKVDWASWVAARQDHKTRIADEEHLPRGSEIHVTEDDAMEMTGEHLDDYLDWFERTWVDENRAERKPRALPKQLLDMFPLGRQEGSQRRPYQYEAEQQREEGSKRQQMTDVMSTLQVRHVVAEKDKDEEAEMVGARYKRYRSVDDLDEHARAFHEGVAESVAVKLETLLTSVLQIERKIILWRESQLKGEQKGSASSTDEHSPDHQETELTESDEDP